MEIGKLRIKKPLGIYRAGQEIEIMLDDGGKPLDLYWRRRLEDARTDGCCELLSPAPRDPLDERLSPPPAKRGRRGEAD
jgi:hypothetical protein